MALFLKKNSFQENKQTEDVIKIEPVKEETTETEEIENSEEPTVSAHALNEMKINNKPKVKIESQDEDVVSKYTGIDFSRFSREKMFSVICELIMEIKRLRFINSKQDSENNDFFNSYKKTKSDYKEIESKIDYIGKKISQNYLNTINSANGPKLTVEQKVSMIVQEVLEERKQMYQEFLNYEQMIKNNKRVLEELKAQLINQTIINNETLADEENQKYTEKDFETFAGQHESASSANGDLAIRVFDIKKTKNLLTDVEIKIIELVGKKGISEYPELLKECTNAGITESKFDTAFNKMSKDYMILDVEQPQTMNRKRGVRVCSLSNDVGKNLFIDLFKTKPVLSEKEKLQRENDNLVHGYSIKEVAQILESRGYNNITYDRKANTFEISGNSRWIPDITALHPTTGRMEYFEVEMGTHTKEDFANKLDKANFRAKILTIVVQSTIIQQKIINKVKDWLAEKDRKKVSLEVRVLTIKDLRDKLDGYIINGKNNSGASQLKDEILKEGE